MKDLKGSLMLFLTALIWGTAFVAQSEGMDHVGPFTYNAMRTLLGGLVLIPVTALFSRLEKDEQSLKAPIKTTVIGGIVCGTVLFAASSFQQLGIVYTTAGKAGFVTALYIIIVPIIGLFLGKRPRLLIWLCAAAAVAGFYLLCIRSDFTVSKGDLLVLAGAAFFAVHIMVIDSFNARGVNGVLMSCIQFFTAGALMAFCMFFFETPVLSEIYSARFTIVYAGVMSCGVAYTLQILGQRRTEPAVATMLMSLESVFAALAGWVILHEALSYRELCGCGLVFAAVLAVQLLPEKSSVKNNVASR